MVRLEVEEFEGRDQDPAAVIGLDLETRVRRRHRTSFMPFVVMFHIPSATLSTLATSDARPSLSHLDAGFGGWSGGRGHKANDHLLSISPQDPTPLIEKRVPRKLPNLLARKEKSITADPESGPFPEVGWDRDTEAFGHVVDYVSSGG